MIAVAPLCACAAVLGIDDGHPLAPGDDGGLDSTMPLADGELGDDAGSDAQALGEPDGAFSPLSCDPGVTSPSASGLFVAPTPTGDDSAACTQAAPCATIHHAINIAENMATPPPIYLQEGTYTEQVTLQPGTQVTGGWSSSWVYDCAKPTLVQAPSTATTTVIASFGANGQATLQSLTIASKASANAGETLIGVEATGAATVLNLSYVGVNVAGGGDGLPGVAGDAGPNATGACTTPGDGGSSNDVGGKGMGADAGWFLPSGFGSMTGGPGGTGGSGMNGAAGSAGACVHCYASCTGSVVCSSSDGGVECGGEGEPGCGGAGGFGGVGGGTGGSSVALFVSGATVVMKSGTLQTGNGGNGGNGGPGGGVGGESSGAYGTPSVASDCYTTCASLSSKCGLSGPESADGGAPGGPGGKGATGGTGGDGAGGDSFAIVQLGGSVRQATDAGATQLLNGLPGHTADGGNGAPGSAGPHVQQ